MQLQQEVLVSYTVGGIAWRVECEDAAFSALLVSRYSDFASNAAPEISLRVELMAAPSDDVDPNSTGPFARIAGRDGVLTIEGAGFRGTFHEKSGEGWIAQPRDPAPLETFLSAICAGRLLRDQGFLLHAAAIIRGAEAFVFFGPSGSGKTTVTELVGEGVITDEIAVIRRDGKCYLVSAVPWRGQRRSAPLAGLFRLRKAEETAFAPLPPSQAMRHLLPSVFLPRAETWEVGRFFDIAQDLVKQVPCYEMSFALDGSFWDAIPGRRTEEILGLAL